MKYPILSKSCAFAAAALFTSVTARAAAPLEAGEPLVLTGTHGRFDFLAIDPERRRLLAAHTENGSLDVIDLDARKLVKSVPVGGAQGSAVDAKNGRYLVSVSKPPQMAVVDARTLEVTGKVPLSGPADVMAFNPASGLAYVCHDDASEAWVVDPASGKVAGSVQLPSDSPEDLAFDSTGEHLFQNMKTGSVVVVIDTKTNKVTASWPTLPAEKPHGMAMIPDAGRFLVVGGNGKLVLMNCKDGKVIASANVAAGVDQIAYDPGLKRAYCASGSGVLSVVGVERDTLTPLGDVPTASRAHSVAVDARTHKVWIAYVKDAQSIVQPFTPPIN